MKKLPATSEDTFSTRHLVSALSENAFRTLHLARAPSKDVEEILNSFRTGKSRHFSGSNKIAYVSGRPNSKRRIDIELGQDHTYATPSYRACNYWLLVNQNQESLILNSRGCTTSAANA